MLSLRALLGLGLVVASAACGGGGDAAPTPSAPPAPATALLGSGAPPVGPSIDAGITTLPTFDPGAGHLDGDDGADGASRRPVTAVRNRRTLELTLRSTPAGAIAAVDGVVIGRTPTYWEGDFTGREREFTFVLAGHAIGRYRFVPTASGVVHAPMVRLETPRPGDPLAIPTPLTPAAPTTSTPPPPAPKPPPDAAPPPPPVVIDAAPVIVPPPVAPPVVVAPPVGPPL